jgi:hypothetical protein
MLKWRGFFAFNIEMVEMAEAFAEKRDQDARKGFSSWELGIFSL